MDFLRKTRLWQRFVMLGVIATVMCLVPLTKLIMIKQSELAVARAELAGLDPVLAVIDLQKLMQKHREVVDASFRAGEAPAAKAATPAADVEKSIGQLKQIFAASGYVISAQALDELAADWSGLSGKVKSGDVKAEDARSAHRDLIARVGAVLEHVADESTLSLDPAPESYYLMTALIDHAPRLAEALERLRIRSMVIESNRNQSESDRALLGVIVERSRYLETRRAAQVGKALAIKPELKPQLARSVQDAARAFTTAASAQYLDGKSGSENPVALGAEAVRAEYESIDEIAKTLHGLIDDRASDVRQQITQILLTVLGLGLGAIVLGIAITRSVTRPLDRAVAAAGAVSEGNLEFPIEDDGRDEAAELLTRLRSMQEALRQRREDDEKRLAEIKETSERDQRVALEVGEAVRKAAENDLTWRISVSDKEGLHVELCKGVNDILESMASVVSQVKEASDTINTASREIASGNTDLSSRTEEQASSLQETAASMEQLNSAVRQNSDAARQASQLAVGAFEVAGRGGSVMHEVVDTMQAISEASGKIADIISVIDGIAFQTNILALNAAVEAARAGEQGRGFAVVASEVRALAQRSAAAAKEIKALISDSSDKVSSGSRLVHQAGETMREIEASVKHVTELMAEIATASAEQSSGIQQISEAVTQMDDMTQQNAALVEEAAAAAESLQGQAETLYSSVSRFRVDASAGGAIGGAGKSAGTATASAALAAAMRAPVARPLATSSKTHTQESRAGAPADTDWEEF
jgi:methyl-accepting chemotaxis protein